MKFWMRQMSVSWAVKKSDLMALAIGFLAGLATGNRISTEHGIEGLANG